jgi:hypothetical protein
MKYIFFEFNFYIVYMYKITLLSFHIHFQEPIKMIKDYFYLAFIHVYLMVAIK